MTCTALRPRTSRNTCSIVRIPRADVPYLLRWDYDAARSEAAIIKDKVFWFASAEGIHENRQLNFRSPSNTPQFLIDNEKRFNEPTTDRETRLFARLDQVLGKHHLTEQMNYTNVHVNSTNPLSLSTSLPSTRTNLGDRNLFLGFSDTATFGNSASPFILSLRGQYRREPTVDQRGASRGRPQHTFNIFSGYNTGGIFGDMGHTQLRRDLTPSNLDQKYVTFGASLAKTDRASHHQIRLGF